LIRPIIEKDGEIIESSYLMAISAKLKLQILDKKRRNISDGSRKINLLIDDM
jgi:hypothetical protein